MIKKRKKGRKKIKKIKVKQEKKIVNQLKNKFKFVSYFKPDSSRKDSSEIFIIARKFIK